MESELKINTEEIGAFSKEKTSRLRSDNRQKILAEGFLSKQSDGGFGIGSCNLPCGAEIEIKFEDAWLKLQIEIDGEGNPYLTNSTCSFYPIKAYARYWGSRMID